MGRAPCCAKVGLKKGRWSAEEDAILVNYIKQRGEAGAGSWRSLPKNAGLLRCGKSCRLRWINYLRSDLRRGNFTSHEQDTIIKLHAQLGNKWSLIANQLEGRTDNEIKNYWNSSLSRRSATSCTTDSAVPTIVSCGTSTPSSSLNININSNITPAAAPALVLPQTSAAAAGANVIDNALVLVKKRRGRTSRAAMKKNKSIICVKSNKYHQARAPLHEHAPKFSFNNDLCSSSSSSSSSAITNCSLSRANSCTTYETVCLTSSAMTSTQTPDPGVGKKDQISQNDALELKQGFLLETFLFGQNDSQSCMNQRNINVLLDLDAENFHEGVGLSFDDDVGMMANIYREYELAVNAKGSCDGDREIKTTTIETSSSVPFLASPIQAAEDTHGALLSAEWDWINNVIVHPDIIENQIWGHEQDYCNDMTTWLWEYDQ